MKMNSVYSKSGYAEGKYEMDIKWAFNALQIRSLDFKHCSWIGLEVKKMHEIDFQKIAHSVTSPEF